MCFEEYISSMTTRELVSHILCPAIRPTYQENSDPREYFDCIFKDKTVKPGTVFFFKSKKQDIIDMSLKLTEYLGSTPLIAMDMETSPSTGIMGTTNFGSGMAISAANSVEDAYICGEACALEGLECGVNWAFGPVADLNRNPNNPIINTRSWSDDADRASKFLLSFVNGMQDNGMIAAAKHFPGDGMDSRDQHLCTTVNSCTKEEWLSTYGKVWKTLIDNGLRSIMPGHIALPAFEEDGEIRPATISHSILTDLLRNELGFDGLIVSDAINMGGFVPYVSSDDGIIQLVNAGCDVLLFANFWADLSYVTDVLENAVKSGKISIERIKDSVYRIWKEKERLGLLGGNSILYKEVPQEKRELYKATASKIATNAISVHKNNLNVIPLDESIVKKVISVDVTNSEGKVKNGLDTVMRENGIEILKYGAHTDSGLVRVMDLPKADAIILNFYYRNFWASNHITPNGFMLQKIYEYIFKTDMPVIMVCHGSPYIPYTFPYIKTVVNTFSFEDIDPQAIYDVIFGKRKASGVTPVKLP